MSSEMLSAALDGELRPDELDGLLAEIERSPQLKLQWSRMSLARDALGGAQVRADRPCIAAAVMAGVGAEAPSQKVVPLVPKNRVSGRIRLAPGHRLRHGGQRRQHRLRPGLPQPVGAAGGRHRQGAGFPGRHAGGP